MGWVSFTNLKVFKGEFNLVKYPGAAPPPQFDIVYENIVNSISPTLHWSFKQLEQEINLSRTSRREILHFHSWNHVQQRFK